MISAICIFVKSKILKVNYRQYLIAALILSCLIFIVGCKSTDKTKSKSEQIIDNAFKASGSALIENSTIEFNFRDRLYRAKRNNGRFKFEREFQDSTGTVLDVLTNERFHRFINDSIVNVPDSMAVKYQNSVNAVHYFLVLPLSLKDKAVNSDYLGSTTIKGHCYDLVKVTFDEVGGGEDHNDEFLYWFNCETHLIDYMAYLYYTDGGGIRFREAINQRNISGVIFNDYNNYKPKKEIALTELDSLFEAGQLDLLSKIENQNISVELIDRQ